MFQAFRSLLLDYVNLVPGFSANFFKWCVQHVHKPLFPAGQPLRVVVQRRSQFGVAELFRDVKKRHVRREQE